jgi:phosphopantothenoylcysteine synthetase/decarboxylase
VTAPTDGGPVLTAVVCGAGPAPHVDQLVRLAQARGWRVGIVATPAALPFLDVPRLEELTSNPVRSEQRAPQQPRTRSLPEPSAMVIAPATYNTICKLASGISDTYALDVLAEGIGRGVPVAVLPFVNTALAGRKPFLSAVESLREEGLRVLLGPGQWLPHPPGTGDERIGSFPWAAVLDAAGVRPVDADQAPAHSQ